MNVWFYYHFTYVYTNYCNVLMLNGWDEINEYRLKFRINVDAVQMTYSVLPPAKRMRLFPNYMLYHMPHVMLKGCTCLKFTYNGEKKDQTREIQCRSQDAVVRKFGKKSSTFQAPLSFQTILNFGNLACKMHITLLRCYTTGMTFFLCHRGF